MENEKTKRESLSLWQEIVYLAKLMWSVILYHHHYEEGVNKATWQRIMIMAGIATIVSTVMTQIILMLFRFRDLGGLVTIRTRGFALLMQSNVLPPKHYFDRYTILSGTRLYFCDRTELRHWLLSSIMV